MKFTLKLLLGMALLSGLAFGQATMTQTTITEPVTASSGELTVASVTGFTVGNIVFIDKEAMRIVSINSANLNVNVDRGAFGTGAVAHVDNSVAFTGTKASFLNQDPSGACTRSQIVALPTAALATGRMWDCDAVIGWYQTRGDYRLIKNVCNENAKVGTTAGWVVAAASNIRQFTVPAAQTGSTLVVPVCGLAVDDVIIGFHVSGQIESAGNTATLDADLRKHVAVAADNSDGSVGSITQVSATADTLLTTTQAKTGLSEVVSDDEAFYVLITATTAAATDVALNGVVVYALRPR
jgi:hypothetical protein